ncbi:MAG: lysoplasmalogenase [Lachnospiraceae bacterium]|nr:lysoplasmalogenase [Lachnospiraceae bacterium]
MMPTFFLILYGVISVVHLYGSAICNQTVRDLTKPLLMPALAAFYITSTDAVNPFVVGMIATSWLGDMLLMVHGLKWFVSGGVSFLFTHLLLILAYLPKIGFGARDGWIIAAYLVFGGGLIRSSAKHLKKYLPRATIGMMTGYLAGNALMNLFAGMQALSSPSTGTVLILVGAFLFLLSDGLLFQVRFNKKAPFYHMHFNVMLTYILAKFMIVLGFLCN